MTAPAVLETDDERWTTFAANCPAATPFHHPSWARVLARTYGMRSFALAVQDEQGHIVAGAPFIEARGFSLRRRWLSLPFTDECVPLATDEQARRLLIDRLGEAYRQLRAPRIEVRGPVDNVGWTCATSAVSHSLDLSTGLEQVRRGFSKSQVIRNIARAEREGAVTRSAESREDLDAFYGLHLRTRRRQGVPVQPRRFFDLLWTELVERGLGTVVLADAGGRSAVAGALFLHWNGTTIYKFGASDPDAWPLRPNHAIFWSAIQDACDRGDTVLDFGRTDLGNDGLRAFKTAWGGRERPLAYSYLAPGAACGEEGLMARALGVLIRRGPPWFGRGVGAAFYRFAA